MACYLPPNYNVHRGKEALEHIENIVIDLKRTYKDPFIMVTGDFNQWPVQDALQEFPDIREIDVGPTRGDRSIDRIFSNFGRAVTESGTVPPLEPEPGFSGTRSDHRIAFAKANMPRNRTFEWVTYQYRFYNQEAVKDFGTWLAGKDWADVAATTGSNQKAEVYQREVIAALESYFPLITVRKKSTDCPWINNRIRKLISRRKGIYRREGRSSKWRRLKKVTEDLIRRRREVYLESQKECLLVDDARRNFFRNVKAFKSKDRPSAFDPMELYPGKSEAEVAGELASYFNRISCDPENPQQEAPSPEPLPGGGPHPSL